MLYAERQHALLEAGRRHLDGLVDLVPDGAGMHLVGWLPPGIDDDGAAKRAAEHGVAVEALSAYSLASRPRGALLLGYAAVAKPTIRLGVRKLSEGLRGAPPVHRHG